MWKKIFFCLKENSTAKCNTSTKIDKYTYTAETPETNRAEHTPQRIDQTQTINQLLCNLAVYDFST